MFKRFAVTLIALTNFAACAGGSVTPNIPSRVQASDRASIEESLRSSTPTIAGHVSYPVRSAGGYLWVGGRKYASVVNGHCRVQRLSNNQVVGCFVRAGRTAFVQKSIVGLFTGPNATGCVIAEARYRGEVVAGQVIPFVFYWVNNSCYG